MESLELTATFPPAKTFPCFYSVPAGGGSECGTQSCPTLMTPWTVACPWALLGENIGVGCHFLLQVIFPTQGSNLSLLCLLHCRQILYH